jgi:glycosyltransferase involved in cell wall biosynthesis
MTLSIICPTLNEEKYIADTLQSFLAQEYHSFDLEILIVDGRSTDKTRDIVNALSLVHPNIKIVDNPDKKTPFAFNAGLKAASGEYVAILGAHTKYNPNYLQACYNALIESKSVGCTGRVVVKSLANTMGAKLSEWITNSRFGVSGSSFRAMKDGYVHSVNFPVFKKQALIDLGGYDTKLLRNQDNDMNQRLLDSGHKLYCTWQTVAYYRPPGSLKALMHYAFRNGFWNAISIYINAGSMRLHHLIPFLFTTSIIAGVVLGITELLVLKTSWLLKCTFLGVGTHLFIGLLVSVKSNEHAFDYRKILMPFIFFAFHFMYGWGTINGFLKGKKEIQ